MHSHMSDQYFIISGMDNYERLLSGAHFMDQHFQSAPLDQNVSITRLLGFRIIV